MTFQCYRSRFPRNFSVTPGFSVSRSDNLAGRFFLFFVPVGRPCSSYAAAFESVLACRSQGFRAFVKCSDNFLTTI